MPSERGVTKWLDLFRSASVAGRLEAHGGVYDLLWHWHHRPMAHNHLLFLWGDFLHWLKLPDISNLEKDALTALLFFLPLGISSLISAAFSNRDGIETTDGRSADRLSAIVFGMLFFLIICGGLSLWSESHEHLF